MNVLLMDVDGVLVQPPELFGARLMREHPEATRDFFYGPFLACSTGQADLRDHLPDLLARMGRPNDLDVFLREWFESENHPDAALLDALRDLRGRGWHIHLATNQERHRLTYLLDTMRFAEFAAGTFASCLVGARKPDAAYYARVTEALPGAQRIVFWDDAPANVDAARAAGWEAHVFTGTDDFRRVMR